MPASRLAFVHRIVVASILLAGLGACAAGPGGSVGATSPPSPSDGASPPMGEVRGSVTAGPVCPVERIPPDPSCAPRPVAGAVLVVQTSAGRVLTRATSATDGTFRLSLAPGAYRLVPQPVTGYLGTPGPITFQVAAGESTPDLKVSYDTGIR